eukprot:TRINITY_DN5880_c0_g1_i15.p1 TRINITY_DN5880_c0_g1~~TRINITY_DN5880_c0_g1_i15.p1  ORF type:complete len:276 (-),score=43.54 TRINITY_DN5880_c0_g1_i15:374-1201(-)
MQRGTQRSYGGSSIYQSQSTLKHRSPNKKNRLSMSNMYSNMPTEDNTMQSSLLGKSSRRVLRLTALDHDSRILDRYNDSTEDASTVFRETFFKVIPQVKNKSLSNQRNERADNIHKSFQQIHHNRMIFEDALPLGNIGSRRKLQEAKMKERNRILEKIVESPHRQRFEVNVVNPRVGNLRDMRNHDDVLLNQFIDKLGREDYDFKIDPEVEWELYKRNIEYITRDLDTVHPVRTIAPFDPSREQRLMNRTRKPYPKMKREPAHATFDPDNSILDQ